MNIPLYKFRVIWLHILSILFPLLLNGQTVKIKIDYQYDEAKSFSEGLAAVKKEDKWGYIDNQGSLVWPYKFDLAMPFEEGLAAVKLQDKWGYFNKKGEIITGFQFNMAESFSEGLAVVKLENKYGFIDKNGHIVISPQYKDAKSFSNGLAAVKQGSYWGYINKVGKVVIEKQYSVALPFSEEYAWVEKYEQWSGIKKDGSTSIYPQNMYQPSSFSEGLAIVGKLANNEPPKWGYFNYSGLRVIDFDYDEATSFLEGLAAVRKGSKWGFIDKTGKVIISYQYDKAKPFNEGLAAVKLGQKWGYINKAGVVVIDYQFALAMPFTEGTASASKLFGGRVGFLKKLTKEELVKEKVIARINEWQKKDMYESTDQYRERVSKTSRDKKILELTKTVTNENADNYVKWNSVSSQYDADNELFKISIEGLSEFYIKVPRSEAKSFNENLNQIEFNQKELTISTDNNFILSDATIVNPIDSKIYAIDKSQTQPFSIAKFEMSFEPIDFTVSKVENNPREEVISTISVGDSDVDINIPSVSKKDNNSFAVIIGNETYSREISVPFALNDALIFKKYVDQVLGVPESQIRLLNNATFGQILEVIEWITSVMDAYDGTARVYFYYAGHGVPDESSKSAYILPADGYSSNLNTSIKLEDIYSSLTKYPSKSVTVFLDACFSGGSRTEMLTKGRGVSIKPKEEVFGGNMIVFSATSGDETAHPYYEQSHGLFTYYLLNKMQSSAGDVSWDDLSSYVIQNVYKASVVNNRPQTPSINVGSDIQNTWQKMILK